MSVKLYHGRVLHTKDFVAIKKQLMAIRAKAMGKVKLFIDNYIYLTTTMAMIKNGGLDDVKLPPSSERSNFKWETEPFYTARIHTEEAIRKCTESQLRADSYLDLTYSVVLFPLKKKTKTLVMPYINNRILEKYAIGKEYGYWDNVDPLEGVSRQDWNTRRKEWAEAIPGYEATASYGYVFEIITKEMMISHLFQTATMQEPEIKKWCTQQCNNLKKVINNGKKYTEEQIVEANGKTIYQMMFPNRSKQEEKT